MTTETDRHGDVSRRERKKAETRARIVASATALFLERGYDATTMRDITDKADVAPRTFYLHFRSKADVALARYQDWFEDFMIGIEATPEDVGMQELLEGTLERLGENGYASGIRLRDSEGRPIAPVVAALLLSESHAEVAGRFQQLKVAALHRLATFFRDRFHYETTQIEPYVIASALTAAWTVGVYGFGYLVGVTDDPPAPDELSVQSLSAYLGGLRQLARRHLG
ncbi:MAG: TetR/AcrR family transcriptional regulator [Acidimicrobiales bacterium]